MFVPNPDHEGLLPKQQTPTVKERASLFSLKNKGWQPQAEGLGMPNTPMREGIKTLICYYDFVFLGFLKDLPTVYLPSLQHRRG